MHNSVMEFGRRMLTPELCADNLVLEVGSHNVNGSLREHIMSYGPSGYVGIDLTNGPGVDIRCSVEDAYEDLFQPESFGLVVCTEMLEHADEWQSAVASMVDLIHFGGSILLTTRSVGFPYHAHPNDYWRFSTDQMTAIAAACGLVGDVIPDPDPQSPGVFLYARRGKRVSRYRMFDWLERIAVFQVVEP